MRGRADRVALPDDVAEGLEAGAGGRGRGSRDGEGVEVEAHLADVGVALADGGGAAAGAHRGGVEVGAVLGERVPAARRDYIIAKTQITPSSGYKFSGYKFFSDIRSLK